MEVSTKPVQKHLFVEVVAESLGNDVIEIRSTSNPTKTYKVDLVKGTCSCPAWIFQRGGVRKPCKHLLNMGITKVHQPKVQPELGPNEL